MKTYKLHQLIEMARDGKKFKATYGESPNWLLSNHFHEKWEWLASSVTADWTVEFEPEVVEFDYYYEHGVLAFSKDFRKLEGKNWHIVATEKVEGE